MRYGAKRETARRPPDPSLGSFVKLMVQANNHSNFAVTIFAVPTRDYKNAKNAQPNGFQ